MEDVNIVEEFLHPRFTGYGSGYGEGSGDGYGSGDGDGEGSGDGYGSGYGDGEGSGYGYGDGDGDGDGEGSGCGYCDGYGDGYGYGDGLKTYDGRPVYYIDGVQTLIERVRGDYAKGYIISKDLTIQPCYVARCENSFAHGLTLKEAVRDAEAKAMEDLPEEERIARFLAQFPSLNTKAKCSEFYKWHHILTGSCTMGRNEFIKANGLDMDADYSVEYFLDVTAESYGGDTIRKVKKMYTNK